MFIMRARHRGLESSGGNYLRQKKKAYQETGDDRHRGLFRLGDFGELVSGRHWCGLEGVWRG